MQLAKFLNKLFKKDGFVLCDANNNRHIIGNPNNKTKPLTLKLLNKKLHYKLLIYPDLYFGEAYANGDIEFENGNLLQFLNLALENIGRKETNKIGEFFNKIRGSYRFLTNFNYIIHLTWQTSIMDHNHSNCFFINFWFN